MSSSTEDSPDEGEGEFSVAELGIPEYKPVVTSLPRAFEPWHRPRKQFVRKSQWVACLKDIYDGRDPADRVNYLGLPGTDLLDLRAFYEAVCVPQRRVLRFLGFHYGASPGSNETVSLDISLQEVKLRELVHESSRVLHDDINMIGSGDSRAFQEARRSAPYDVINLDLTVGVAKDPPKSLDSVYNTLNKIMAMQQRLEPWLLFVTGQVGRDVFDVEAARVLQGLFLSALQCPGFPEACIPCFEADDLESLDVDSCSDSDYFYCMAIGFCIWVFRLAQMGGAKRVNLRAAFYYYQVYPQGPRPDMISMAIRFRPDIAATPDPSGLAMGDENHISQCETSVQFATKMANAVDVDHKLAGDSELREKLIDESAQLLLEAGYDEGGYRQWVAQFSS